MMTIKKYQDEEIVSQTFLAEKIGKRLSTINHNIKKLKKEGIIE